MSRMQTTKCQKMTRLHKCSNIGEEKGPNQQLSNSEDAIDVLEERNSRDLTVRVVKTTKLKVSSYSDKQLPFNKRRSQYYVLPGTKEKGNRGSELKPKVKIRTLESIYSRTKPISAV
ncbi:hypothetical protein SOVF_008940 isoform A [Spinacia oleracea]|nr:hypothetical protein SOVF_008940 isoform A [Spinacia oleracea]